MEPQTYPTMAYHPTEAPVMCQTEEEVAALGPFWRPTPYTPEDIVQWRAAQAAGETPHPAPHEEDKAPTPRVRH